MDTSPSTTAAPKAVTTPDKKSAVLFPTFLPNSDLSVKNFTPTLTPPATALVTATPVSPAGPVPKKSKIGIALVPLSITAIV
ncbi:hypothetical protein D5R81_13985 [Parashewanella spongiae]|uniref:Uncharacterized protein n=1 Tax=Parashewanella spongiae TaxID=342950 RepID=A0A3A6T889_9GAMM|nr:hypothetical protein [Parashewanella spongiae]MCL1079159.1 hypothetical protein [Parashewanella spongiae]RJY06362.1 hypothetical protein D5R81_17830 [Parashewanella spongiae]RJY10763.1 hypothetical protein D5R81_13985 [Parashewanella spongiae]